MFSFNKVYFTFIHMNTFFSIYFTESLYLIPLLSFRVAIVQPHEMNVSFVIAFKDLMENFKSKNQK